MEWEKEKERDIHRVCVGLQVVCARCWIENVRDADAPRRATNTVGGRRDTDRRTLLRLDSRDGEREDTNT